jgi:CBS domain-containing protein
MKVKEIITRELKYLSGNESVKEALEIISSIGISGLPVIDKHRNLLGMFTEKDVLRVILPSYLKQVGGFVYEKNPKNIRKKLLSLSTVKVVDVMHKEIETVNEDTSLSEAARIMLVKNIRRIPVLDKNKKVIGIIARCDIVETFRKMAEVNG